MALWPRNKVEVEVTQSGIFIHSRSKDAEPATVTVPSHPYLKMWLNGQEVVGEVQVHALDKIEISVLDSPSIRRLDFVAQNNDTVGFVEVTYEPAIWRVLTTVRKSNVVELTLSETESPVEPFTTDEVLECAKSKGIVLDEDLSHVAEFLKLRESGLIKVASGIPVVESLPARFEVTVSDSQEVNMVGIYNVRHINQTEANAAIGKLCPRQDGAPGVDIYGHELLPASLPESQLVVGSGARLEDSVVYANYPGRVVCTGDFIDVMKVFEHKGNYRALDGQLTFHGDVYIHGDVEDGVEIVADGSVVISGNVSNAHIIADQGVNVSGNTFGTTLYAGTRKKVLSELRAHLNTLQEEFGKFVGSVTQIQSVLRDRGTDQPAGKIAAMLLDEKFQHLLRWGSMIEPWRVANQYTIGLEWNQFVEELERELTLVSLTQAHTCSDFDPIIQKIQQHMTRIPTDIDQEVTIQVRNAQNCTIESSGSILSTGLGFYQCHIQAAQAVRAPVGVILGCNIKTFYLEAKEIGSHGGSHTIVELHGREGKIEANLVYPETTLSIGPWKKKVEQGMEQVTWP